MKSDVGHLQCIKPSPLPPLLATLVVTQAVIKLLIHLVELYLKKMMEENTVRERKWQLIVD